MSGATPAERWQIHYEGRVQGVGFRYTTHRIAARMPITGYVKNLPDGRVVVVAEGQPAELQRLVDAVAAELGRHIRRRSTSASPASGEFDRFDVRF